MTRFVCLLRMFCRCQAWTSQVSKTLSPRGLNDEKNAPGFRIVDICGVQGDSYSHTHSPPHTTLHPHTHKTPPRTSSTCGPPRTAAKAPINYEFICYQSLVSYISKLALVSLSYHANTQTRKLGRHHNQLIRVLLKPRRTDECLPVEPVRVKLHTLRRHI